MTTQLGAQDAQFLYLQTADVLTHVMSINVFDPATAPHGRVRYADIVRQVVQRCRRSAVYHRRLYRLPGDFDFPYWVEDPDFRPEEHVTRMRLPRPGNWAQFCRQAARRFAEPMDLHRPLWDIQVVEGLDAVPGVAPGSYALLQRFHHAAIDGASGAFALAVLCDRDAAGTPVVAEAAAPASDEAAPSATTVVTRAIASSLLSPVRIADAVLRLSPSLLGAAQRRLRDELARRSASVPVTRFNRRVSAQRLFASTSLDLEALQAIRRTVEGATINDVILAVCGGGLRAYLEHHGELPPHSLVALAPVNARQRSGRDARSGNDISAMSIPLATGLKDPLQRLRAIRQCTDEAKQARAGIGARLLADVGRHIPGAPLAGFARLLGNERFARSQANLVITNVPSTREPWFMNGARLTRQFGMGPVTHGLGLFISANGYHQTIELCMTADRGLLPDLEFLRACMERAYADLVGAARGPRGRPRAGGARRSRAGRVRRAARAAR